MGPFVRTVPWNSWRVQVAEDDVRMYQRVVAFETPAAGEGGPLHAHTAAGKLIVVLTNEGAAEFNTTVATADRAPRLWAGFSFAGSADGSAFNVSLGVQSTSGASPAEGFLATLAPYTVQWWYEQ